MLLSMTGFGEARVEQDGLAVTAEVRAINSRYFKLSLRTGDGYNCLEAEIESLVRQRVKRGTLQVELRVHRQHTADEYRLNAVALASYREQLEHLHKQWHVNEPVHVESLLELPGVVEEQEETPAAVEQRWPVIKAALEAALTNLERMRTEEGRNMAADLSANCAVIGAELALVESRAPQVVSAHRARLTERMQKLLAEHRVGLEPGDLLREVALFAERSDVSEEIVRLKSHLEQFADIMDLPESSGRKLEFLTQELFREANTIGSKANDVEIARRVIEMKTAIEKIREMIQNVE
jgi:uncharacterized protein (TIGR00255 family)